MGEDSPTELVILLVGDVFFFLFGSFSSSRSSDILSVDSSVELC
jgi:hypothetical protein